MRQHTVYKIITAMLFFSALLLAGCSDDKPVEKSSEVITERAVKPGLIARVGDEVITYGQLNTMLNSSAMVGRSIPSLGTPERNQMMLNMLDRLISANLIYLDAKDKGTDRLTSYLEDVNRFEDAIIASLYKSKIMAGDTRVGETEVLHHYNTQTSREVEMTDHIKLTIEAMIRKKKLDEFEATLHDRLRENVEVVINELVLSADYDDIRSDAEVVASYDNHRITWSQVKGMMQNANSNVSQADIYIRNYQERLTRLQQFIDNAIMTLKGRAAGLENDAAFVERAAEYRKARLINEHRNGLIHSWNPSEDELKTYVADNPDKFTVPEARRVQMVLVKTREEAESIKAQIDKGELSLGQAARQYSLDPDSKHTQGEIGWVRQAAGSGGLEALIFKLKPEVVGGPVESPAGWHLAKVLAVIEPKLQRLDDPETRERAFRAYMQDRFDDYVVDLRRNHFEVVVYNEELQRQFQNEADFIAELSNKAQREGTMTEQRIEDMQKWVTSPELQ